MMQFLLQHSFSPDDQDIYNRIVLIQSIVLHDENMFRFLLSHIGCKHTIPDRWGCIPLDVACFKKDEKKVKLLLEQDA